MNFDFSDEQHMLRDEVRRFLVKESPLKVAREVLERGLTHSEPVWRGLAGLGATALMLPEDCGGAGLGAMELCVVAEEIGRQLSPVPLASTLYLAAQAVLLGGTAAQQQRWLSPVAEGAIGAFAAPLDGVVDVTVLPCFDGQCLTGTVPLVADGAGALDVGDVGVPRQEDAGHGRVARAQALEQLEAGQPRHLVVGDQQVERLAFEQGQGVLAVAAAGHREPVSGGPLEEVEDVRLVVDCQEAQAGGRHESHARTGSPRRHPGMRARRLSPAGGSRLS